MPNVPAARTSPFVRKVRPRRPREEARRLPRPDAISLAAVRPERLDVYDPVLGEDPGPELLGEIEIVLVQAVLGVLAAAGHALAAKLAADTVRPLALEIGVRGRLAFLAEINADRRQAVGRFAPDLGRRLLHQDVLGGLDGIAHDPEHAPGQVVIRKELIFPAEPADARPLEEDVGRDIERIGVIEAPAADPGAGQDEDPVQQAQAPGAVEAERGKPKELAQVPIAAGEFVGVPALAGFDDADRVALLGQPHGGDAAAEARPDDQIIENELVRLVHFPGLRPTLQETAGRVKTELGKKALDRRLSLKYIPMRTC